MLSKRRSKEEIMMNVLEATLDGASAYKIMCHSLLNYNQSKRYIDYALSLDLIRLDGNMYRITQKGKKYIELFRDKNLHMVR